MPIVKAKPASKKGPSLEERMKMVAAAEAKARRERMKRRDRRNPVTKFIQWLPVWWTRVNENNTSLYLFHEKSRVRRNAWRLIRWRWFDRAVMGAIVVNCVFLAMYDPTQPDDSGGNQMLNMVEMAFTVVFTVEFVIQIVARNFLIGPGAYLKNPWFFLDFVIVVAGWLALIFAIVGMAGGGNVSGIRTLRALKPLRTISGVPGLRVLVTTIVDSTPFVGNACLILVWLFFVFGVVGIDMFAGQLTHRCFTHGGEVVIREEANLPCDPGGDGRLCGVGEFCLDSGLTPNGGYTSFDNILWASLTVFQTLTMRGWSDVSDKLEAATGTPDLVKMFFVAMVFIGGFFAMTLITSVLVAEFHKTSVLERKTGTAQDGKAVRRMKRRLNRKPWFIRGKRFLKSEWFYQKPLKALVTHRWFDRFVTLLIVANTVTLASEYHGMEKGLYDSLQQINLLLTLAFALEMVLKVLGLGALSYCSDRMNLFDATIVIVSIVEMLSSQSSMSVLRAFRLVRVLRSVKFLRQYKRMRQLMENISRGISGMVDFLLLTLLFVFIFSVLGMQIFGGGEGFAGERKNFDSFGNSFLLVFEMLTGSDWYYTMWNGMDGEGKWASLYFVVWMLLGHFIILDLLLANMVFNFSLESEDERLERLEKEMLQKKALHGDKRDLNRTGGAEVITERMTTRKSRIFAKEARAMQVWLRETGQSYGDDDDFSSDDDEEDARSKKKVPTLYSTTEGAEGAETDGETDGEGEEAEDESSEDDAEDGAPEDEFTTQQVDPQAELRRTLAVGVAVPVNQEQVDEAERKTVQLHGARRPLDKFRAAGLKAITGIRMAGNQWHDPNYESGMSSGVSTASSPESGSMSSRSHYTDLTGLEGEELEDAILQQDNERKKARRRALMSSVSKLVNRKSRRQLMEEEEAAAVASTSGFDTSTMLTSTSGRRSSVGRAGTASDVSGSVEGTGSVLDDIFTDTLRRAEASGANLSREEIARRMGWDPSALSAVGTHTTDTHISGSSGEEDDGMTELTYGDAENYNRSNYDDYSSRAHELGFGSLAMHGGRVPSMKSGMSFAEKTARLARERSSRNVGGYQGEGVDPEIAAKLRSMGIESGEPTEHSTVSSPNSSRSPQTLRRRSIAVRPETPPSSAGLTDLAEARGSARGTSEYEPSFRASDAPPEAATREAVTAQVAAQPRARAFGRAPAFPGRDSPGRGGREQLHMVPPGVEAGVKRSDATSALEGMSSPSGSNVTGVSRTPHKAPITADPIEPGSGKKAPAPFGAQVRQRREGGILDRLYRAVALGAPPDGTAALAPVEGAESRVTMGRRAAAAGAKGGMGKMGIPAPTLAEQLAALGARNENGAGDENKTTGPGPVTEAYEGDSDGEGEPSLMARMNAARQRGIVNRTQREGFTAEQTQGRAFAQLMSAGAGAMGSNENLPGLANNQRPPSANRTRFANVPPLDLDPLRDGKENANTSRLGTPSKKPPSRSSSIGAGLSMGVSLAATQAKTQELAKGMMQKMEARRVGMAQIQPITNSDVLLEPMPEDLCLPHIGVVVRGGAGEGAKRRMDGIPDRDVIVNLPAKLRERPKHAQKKTGEENILTGGEAPPVYMKHRSLFAFSPQSPFRRVVFMIAFDKKFEYVVLALIFASSIALIVDDPSVEPGSTTDEVLRGLDLSFTTVFFMEMCTKIISMGLVLHPGAYLRDAWNCLDGLIVVTSVLSLVLNSASLTIVRSFRILRALRPLRMVRRLRGMQMVMATLARSLPQIGNVLIFGAFQFVVFGILGVQVFGGMFWRCTDPAIAHLDQCVGQFQGPDGNSQMRQWVNPVLNFDHIGNSMLSLFVVTTMDKWFEIAHRGMDVTEVDHQPVTDASSINVLFFIAFVLLSSLFWVYLLVGALIDTYRRIAAATGEMVFTTPGQQNWAEALKMKQKQNALLHGEDNREPVFFIRKWIFRLVQWKRFEMFIMGCIGFNVFMMILTHEGQPSGLTSAQESLGGFFTWIFVIECALKMTGLGATRYFKDPWNRFDFVVVLGSLPEIFGQDMGPGATLLRTFRLGRLFRLLKDAVRLRALFAALIDSLVAMGNVGSLLFLLMFIYSVLGMNLFGKMEHGQFINESANFENFGNGLLVLFRVFTGDGWSRLMVDAFDCDLVEGFMQGDYYARCRGSNFAAPMFFVTFIAFASFILLNLFIAIMLDKFVDAAQGEGLLSTASFFDLLQRKMLLDGFVERLKQRLEENRIRLGIRKKSGKSR